MRTVAILLSTLLASPGPASDLPKRYACHRAVGGPTINGRLDDPAWAAAAWTDRFVDIEGDRRPAPRFGTRAKMLWDDEYLYVAAELDEPHLRGSLLEHDSVIFRDNDFELFVDPDGDNHAYFEFEINALNTGWDLFLPKPYRDGGKADNGWEIPGLKTAVHLDGTINDPNDVDRGWTIEIAIPWTAFARSGHRPGCPVEGDRWRMNFSRVEWRHRLDASGRYENEPETREDNWVWSPQGVVNMHQPEQWGIVQFTRLAPGTLTPAPDPTGPARARLIQVYEAQARHHLRSNRWAEDLGILALAPVEGDPMPVTLRSIDSGYEASITLPGGGRLTIGPDSRITQHPAIGGAR